MTKLALARPIFIFVLVITTVLIGLMSYAGMRKENNPEVNFGTVVVTTAYPGAGPEDVNQLITRKVEQAVSGVSGIREVQGQSQEGISVVTIQLELGVDTESAVNDIRTKVDGILNTIPKDARKPVVAKFDNSSTPVLTLAVSSDKLSSRDLRDLLEDKIIDKFSQVSGVAQAQLSGGDLREIQVRIKKDKLLQYGVGISEVLTAVQSANANVPGGKFVTGGQDVSVRVKGDFTKVDDIENVVIKVSDPNNPQAKAKQIPLGAVAEIVDSVQERSRMARLNGDDTVVVSIQKTKEGNTVEVNTAAKALITKLEKQYPLKFTAAFDESKVVDEALKDVQFSLFFGVFLVAGIVYVFLHNFRGMLIVALAIPTCIFGAFIVMRAVGFTVNTLSMLGLSLAIGVLVDDAIVVLENIFRHLKMGEDPRDAAVNGRNEIGVAALAITLADVVVFLPIAFAGGIAGQFFKSLSLTYVFAVLFSLFVSFTLTPLLAARWYKRGEDIEHPKGWFAIWFEKRFARLEDGYRRTLEWCLNHRWFTFIAGNSLLLGVIMLIAGGSAPDIKAAIGMARPLQMVYVVGGLLAVVLGKVIHKRLTFRPLWGAVLFGLIFPVFAAGGHIYGQWKKESVFKFSFVPSTDPIQVKAAIELPVGSSLEKTDEVARMVERVFVKNPDIKFTITEVGKQSGARTTDSNATNFAEVTGTLYDRESFIDRVMGSHEKLRTRKAPSIVADLTKGVGKIAGAEVRISGVSGFNFGAPIQLALISDNRALLTKTAADIRDRLAAGEIEGVIGPDVSVKSGKPEIRLIPDYRKAADLGIDATQLGGVVRTMYQGNDDSKMRIEGREYGVRVMLDLDDRNNRDTLATVPIRFNQGRPVSAGSVATFDEAPGFTAINRRDRAEEIQVTANLLPGFSNGVVGGKIQTWIKEKKLLPEGVQLRQLGEADAQAREGVFLFTALFLGIFLVYAVLASLYNNYLYPFIIQLAQPQAMVGALLALVITDQAFSVIGFIGIVALVGLVGKNAILLVDYTNTLRERGRSRHDAIVEAGPIRLRPILMTTLALILGLLPVAAALGRGSEFRQSIGTIVLGGIILSTVLTLVVIPCSYTIFDDLSNLFAKWMKKPLSFGGPQGYPSGAITDEAGEIENVETEVETI